MSSAPRGESRSDSELVALGKQFVAIVAGGAVALVATVVIILVLGAIHGCSQPTDDSMAAFFANNRVALDAIVETLRRDDADGDVSARVDRSLGFERVVRFESDDSIRFVLWEDPQPFRCHSLGLMFSEEVPKDSAVKRGEFEFYRALGDRWYAYSIRH